MYTEYSNDVLVNATLKQATNAAETQEWCTYPILEYFSCRIPSQLETKMAEINQTCSVECDLNEPYTITGEPYKRFLNLLNTYTPFFKLYRRHIVESSNPPSSFQEALLPRVSVSR